MYQPIGSESSRLKTYAAPHFPTTIASASTATDNPKPSVGSPSSAFNVAAYSHAPPPRAAALDLERLTQSQLVHHGRVDAPAQAVDVACEPLDRRADRGGLFAGQVRQVQGRGGEALGDMVVQLPRDRAPFLLLGQQQALGQAAQQIIDDVRVDGAEVGKRTTVEDGAEIRVGTTVLSIEDRGSMALWKDLKVDRIVCRVGNKLVVAKGDSLCAIDAYTGVAMCDWVRIPGMRFCPTNTHDSSVSVLVGDASIYSLFPR